LRVAEKLVAGITTTAGVAWASYVLGLGSDAGLTVTVAIVHWWGGLALLGLSAVWLALHWLATREAPERRHLARIVLVPTVLALCFWVVETGLAFRCRFLLSRAALSRFVQEARPLILSGGFSPHVRVGLFTIREAEALPHGVVRLITTECLFNDCGLVYSPEGRPPVVAEDVYFPLGGPWWHWGRSW